MAEILWHRRETRRQTENTNFCLNGGKVPAYSPLRPPSPAQHPGAWGNPLISQTRRSESPCCARGFGRAYDQGRLDDTPPAIDTSPIRLDPCHSLRTGQSASGNREVDAETRSHRGGRQSVLSYLPTEAKSLERRNRDPAEREQQDAQCACSVLAIHAALPEHTEQSTRARADQRMTQKVFEPFLCGHVPLLAFRLGTMPGRSNPRSAPKRWPPDG
jgi:hypothetical protein